jgi:tRNA pseudouridine55 synthase
LQYAITCSKGTYVRALARDIGEFLGCGATLATIRRSKSGSFEVENAQKLSELAQEIQSNKSWLEFDTLVKDFPVVELSETTISDLHYGKQETLQRLKVDGECVDIFNLVNMKNGKSVGLAENINGVLTLKFML